ncbi:MAG TPA: MMPL family transporter [Solirubrobacteraceae bacterium]|nr:MMPL family transporter [Solirubrobacteraceae bacterium]
MSRTWLTFPAHRRGKWVVLAAALLVLFGAGSVAGKFEEVQRNDPVSYLPGDAESVRALELVEDFPSGQLIPAVSVYHRDGGLTPADLTKVSRDRAALNRERPPNGNATGPPVVSPNRTTVLLVTPIRDVEGDGDLLLEATREVRDRVEAGAPPGLEVKVTGPAGFSADAIEVFSQINGTLLIATAGLVFFLLIAIYRSPIFWLIPMFAVAVAETATRALGYGIAEAGVTVNGQSAGVLLVLVFGAGTDYALLLVARYREELRRHEDRHEAMALALRRAGPAILASGFTVIAALLCLTLAEVNGTAGLGPIGAMGVATAMVSMLVVLPALLTIFGRRAFWPFVPHFGDAGPDETHGAGRGIAARGALRPRRVWAGTLAVLAVMSLGVVYLNSSLTSGNSFRGSVDSVEGQDLLEKGFPAGGSAPSTVVVRDVTRGDDVRRVLERRREVARLGPVELGPPGARFDVTLRADPYSDAAFDAVPRLRAAIRDAGGSGTLLGGPTAEERDLRVSATRDNKVIPPLVLLVVALVLAMLLRAVLLPAILIGTVIASYVAALGVGAFFFEHVFGYAGMDPSLPLFAFVFLVALGIDYNIFLMARVREEALRGGTRQGMVRGLAVTGAVITSAGIVLAGTFSALAILPLIALTEIGFTIAFGVLLDTFIVRSLLVPALVFELGPRIWWPSTLSRSLDRRELFRPDADRVEQEGADVATAPGGSAPAPRA